MYRILPICACFFTLMICQCKQPVSNSVNPTAEAQDSVLDYLNDLAFQNQDSALTVIDQILSTDTLVADSLFYYQIMEVVNECYFQKGDFDKCISNYKQSIFFWEKDTTIAGKKQLATSFYNLALISFNLGQYQEALDLYDQVIQIASDVSLYNIQVYAYWGKQKIYSDNDEYGKSIEELEKSIKLCEIHKDTVMLISSLLTYADTYTNCGFFDEAEEQYNSVLEYQDKVDNFTLYTINNNIGRMYYLQNRNDLAISWFLKAYQLARSVNVYADIITSMNLAEVYLNKNELDSAKYFLDVASTNDVIIKTIPSFSFNLLSLTGDYYCKINKNEKALDYFTEADSILKNNAIDNVIKKLHLKREVNYYNKINNYNKAYRTLDAFNQVNLAILETDNTRQVAALKYKYQRDTTLIAQHNLLILKEEEVKSYRLGQFYIISVIIILLFIIVGIYWYFRKNKQLAHEQTMRRVASLKMESMRGRLSPHFLFNVLNNIWASFESDKEASRHQFENLTLLIRKSLLNTDQVSIPLYEEISFVKSYIELQRNRTETDFTVQWNVDPTLEELHVPGMILQIPVENAIKHGLMPKNETGLLIIDIYKVSGSIILKITDNGVGRNKQNRSIGTGTGLKVLNSTIYLLNQINDRKMSMRFLDMDKNGGTGTQVVIEIPIGIDFNLNR